MSKWKSTPVGAIVCIVAGLVFASPAAAHTMTLAKAKARAQFFGQDKVNVTDYVSVNVSSCTRLYPHRVRCTLNYDDATTRDTTVWACTERRMMVYEAHDDDESGNPNIQQSPVGHQC